MKFKLVNNKVTDEREKALNNKVGAECFYIMSAWYIVPSLTRGLLPLIT